MIKSKITIASIHSRCRYMLETQVNAGAGVSLQVPFDSPVFVLNRRAVLQAAVIALIFLRSFIVVIPGGSKVGGASRGRRGRVWEAPVGNKTPRTALGTRTPRRTLDVTPRLLVAVLSCGAIIRFRSSCLRSGLV